MSMETESGKNITFPMISCLTSSAASSLAYPAITVCSPVFFTRERWVGNYLFCNLVLAFRLEFYGLSDDNDDMANYLILSLQTDEVIPGPMKEDTEMINMEERLLNAMEKFNLTRLEMFKRIAVKCEEFIHFVREKSFGPEFYSWPLPCGDIFYNVPIFAPFGT